MYKGAIFGWNIWRIWGTLWAVPYINTWMRMFKTYRKYILLLTFFWTGLLPDLLALMLWRDLKAQRTNFPANTSTLMFGWKWKLSRRTFIDVVSKLTKQRWNDVDRITSIQRRWTNVVSTLKFGTKWKYVYRRCFDVDKTTLKQCW